MSLWLQFDGAMATASFSSLWKLSRVNELSRIPLSGTQILRRFGPALLVASSYYLGTRIGFAWTPSGQPNSTFWPANAILLAAFLLAPQRIWWALLLAVLPAHMIAQLQSGVPVWTASGWFISNSAEGLIGAFFITRFTRQESLFDTVRGVLTFVLCGVLIAPLLTSFLDAAAVVVTGWGHGYWPLGAERFWTNALAQLTIVPAVVLGGVSGISWIRNSNSARRWEAVLLGVSTVLVCLRIRLPVCIRCHDSSTAVFSSPALVVGCSSVPLGRIERFTIVPCADLDVVHDARAIGVSLCLHATEHLVAPDFILLGGGASYVPVGGD